MKLCARFASLLLFSSSLLTAQVAAYEIAIRAGHLLWPLTASPWLADYSRRLMPAATLSLSLPFHAMICMIAQFFIDTNILLYAGSNAPADQPKRLVARQVRKGGIALRDCF